MVKLNLITYDLIQKRVVSNDTICDLVGIQAFDRVLGLEDCSKMNCYTENGVRIC